MKTTQRMSWIAAALATAVLSLHPAAAQKSAKEAEKPQNAADYTKLLPGENHKHLSLFAGKWEATLKIWGHGTPPPESSMRQTMDARWILRDNWLQTDFTHQFANSDALFTGHIFRGYNGATENFVAILMSDGDVRETVSTGTYDPAKKTFVFKGPEKDPVTQDTFYRKETYTFVDADHYRYELSYIYQDGSETKAAEGTFTRVKGKR
jgi:hypothetical protein